MTVTEDASATTPVVGRRRRLDTPRGSVQLAMVAMVAVCAVDVIVGVYYRFTTTSKMWLDEAQTVNIASLPLRSIGGALRHDGAPPLYYYLLHVWMGAFGHSDAAIRSLSGLFGVLALPLFWWVVRRGFGRVEALAALAVLASSPFAVYFATETRMYSLVVLLVVAGIGAVQALLSKPTGPRAALLAVITALLLYTHYWALYLLVVVGCWLLLVAVRGTDPRRRGGAYGLAALVAGSVAWLPWVPTFLYQRAHTGTPWSAAPTLAAAFGWFASFVVNESVQAETLSLHLELALLCFLVLLVFGFAGAPAGRNRLDLLLTGQPRARALGGIAIGTLAVGWVASRAAGTAFQARYSSVVFPVLVILVALGIVALPTRWLQAGALTLVSVLALWTTHWGAHAQRTQAGKVAVVLQAQVPTNSLVVVCPDQLGPSLLRYTGTTNYRFVGYPRFTTPVIVDWVDYKHALSTTSPQLFARQVVTLAGDKPFYLVWSVGYGVHQTCAELRGQLITASGRHPTQLVAGKRLVYYQSMNLLEYAPTTLTHALPK
ncbi:MAG TPA: glycosyltransferase family 39 protein [Acidimicrobiales bacterium]|nr:glycosyltransferase family 39 protein [Acidimicrobiales bacterium]